MIELQKRANSIKEKMLNFKLNNKEVFELFSVTGFSENAIKKIDQIALCRRIVNEDKDISELSKYKRDREDLIIFQTIISEYSLSLYFYKVFKFDKEVDVKTSALVEVNLDHSNEDVRLKINNQIFNMDIKSQYSFNDNLNINVNAHKRFLDHGCDGYIVALIDSESKEKFKNVSTVRYIFISTEYFEKNKKYVNLNRQNSSPFYSISISDILKSI